MLRVADYADSGGFGSASQFYVAVVQPMTRTPKRTSNISPFDLASKKTYA